MNLFAKSLKSSFFLDDFFRLAQASKKSHRVLKRSSDGFGFIVEFTAEASHFWIIAVTTLLLSIARSSI